MLDDDDDDDVLEDMFVVDDKIGGVDGRILPLPLDCCCCSKPVIVVALRLLLLLLLLLALLLLILVVVEILLERLMDDTLLPSGGFPLAVDATFVDMTSFLQLVVVLLEGVTLAVTASVTESARDRCCCDDGVVVLIVIVVGG